MKRFLALVVLLAAIPAHAGQAKQKVYVVQVPHLGKMGLLGKSGPDAIERYVRNTIRGNVFPGNNAALRAWGKQMVARNTNAPTLAEWRGTADVAVSGIELNELRDLNGDAQHKAMRTPYARGLSRGGTLPLFLPPGISRADKGQYLHGLAEVDFVGGDDTHPAYNHQAVTFSNQNELNLVRDRREAGLMMTALAQKKPVRTTCRGTQLANRVLDGDIIQDIYKEGAAKFPHSAPGFRPTSLAVTLTPGARQIEALGEGTLNAPFMHHQAIGKLGRGVVVTGRTADGIVASIEAAGGLLRGTQYHPELSPRSKFSRMIFAETGARARAYRAANPLDE